jgi:hypothetical protein
MPDLADPTWFPVDYVDQGDAFRLLHLDLATIANATFLDRRMAADWENSVEVTLQQAASVPLSVPPAFLFHTAFCGSTLLAMALQCPPSVVSLKEPLLLHTLAILRNKEGARADRSRPDALHAALALLARPWVPGGRVLIKPANQANSLMEPILRQSPHSRAILLYSSLREFMLSCFKKLPEAERRVRWMAQALLKDTRLSAALGIDTRTRFNLVESCALAWYAQIERYADVLAIDSDNRLRTLDMQRMLSDPLGCVSACAEWLTLDIDKLQSRVESVFARDSKATTVAFTAIERDRQKQQVLKAYGPVIDRGIAWAESAVAPHAIVPRDWRSLKLA